MAGIPMSIFLLKQGRVADFEKEVYETAEVVHELSDGFDGYMIPLPCEQKEPGWATAIKGLLSDPQRLELQVQVPGGLLVIKRNGQTFVICFGHGWMRLKEEWIEPDFGRRAALNAIAKDNMLEVRAEQVFAQWHLASERAPRASTMDAFGVEFDRDLVSAVEGVANDPLLGSTLRGGTSLRATVLPEELHQAIDRATDLYASTDYMSRWPEIDNLLPVRDKILIQALEANLDADLAAGLGPTKIILFTPTIRRGESVPVDSYVFGRLTKKGASNPYLTFHAWATPLTAKGRPLTVENAKATPIHMLDEARQELATSYSAFDCFGYETTHNGQHFILSSSVWYQAVQSFVQRINGRMKKLPEPSVVLQKWNGVHSEGEYNRNCLIAEPALLHFDAKNINYGGGQSKFEFCDLMHPKKKILYFAKIASRSSGMSHLVEQVRRTVELLFGVDDGFRKKLEKSFGKHYPKADRTWLGVRPRPGDFDLCLVSLGHHATDLPFFAKCSLARLTKELQQKGHTVSFLAV